ncbi:unnamed protein product [Nezara viridula]|uniref:Uncharacterized protein n=1 Tax=Nezara viridula TaxID=85310 RepID=A0A9P0HD79_NEZVI|nr:unnamed protein product [Nezara viridula]
MSSPRYDSVSIAIISLPIAHLFGRRAVRSTVACQLFCPRVIVPRLVEMKMAPVGNEDEFAKQPTHVPRPPTPINFLDTLPPAPADIAQLGRARGNPASPPFPAPANLIIAAPLSCLAAGYLCARHLPFFAPRALATPKGRDILVSGCLVINNSNGVKVLRRGKIFPRVDLGLILTQTRGTAEESRFSEDALPKTVRARLKMSHPARGGPAFTEHGGSRPGGHKKHP